MKKSPPPDPAPTPGQTGTVLREGDPCLADGLRGIVNAVFTKQTSNSEFENRNSKLPRKYFRVRFPMGSPYLDDWAVFRADECTPAPAKPASPPPEKYKENYPTEKNS